jgi:hypothetical protein
MNLGSMTKKATKQKDPREIRIELRAEIAALEDERWRTGRRHRTPIVAPGTS